MRPILRPLSLLAVALSLPLAGARGAIITVDTFADAVANDGKCSLREAIQAANTNAAYMNCPAGSSTDSILLGAGTYTLTRTGSGEDANSTGDLDVTQRVTLLGIADNVVVTAASLGDRIFEVHPTATRFEVSNVELRGARAGSQSGGAIRATGSTQIVVTGSRLVDNQTNGGGAIHLTQSIETLSAQPWLRIVDSTLQANQATFGGALNVSAFAGGAEVEIERTLFSGNIAPSSAGNPRGGAISTDWSGTLGAPLLLELVDTDFTGNRSDYIGGGGGAIDAVGTDVEIVRGTFENNRSGTADGGALRFTGATNQLAVTATVFRDNNIAVGEGGGGAIAVKQLGIGVIEGARFENNRCLGISEGGAIEAAGNLTVRTTEFAGNLCSSGNGGALAVTSGLLRLERSVLRANVAINGGGIWMGGEELTIDRSTLRLNRAYQSGGGVHVAESSDFEATNSTFTANRARTGGGLALAAAAAGVVLQNVTIALNEAAFGGAGDGGGIYAGAGSTPAIANSIFARNGDLSTLAADQHPDCSGSLQSGGYNLVGIVTGCTITGSSTGNQVGSVAAPVYPHLKALETFAGMPVHRLLFTSPALDTGASGPATGYPQCAPLDQLGQSRPLDGDGAGGARCDIGAVDWALVSATPVFVDDFESGNSLLW